MGTEKFEKWAGGQPSKPSKLICQRFDSDPCDGFTKPCRGRIVDRSTVGLWSDLDCREVRDALKTVGMNELRIIHLEAADVPVRFKIRECPVRGAGESFVSWQRRALACAPKLRATYRGAL
jgi:hypothetical protein